MTMDRAQNLMEMYMAGAGNYGGPDRVQAMYGVSAPQYQTSSAPTMQAQQWKNSMDNWVANNLGYFYGQGGELTRMPDVGYGEANAYQNQLRGAGDSAVSGLVSMLRDNAALSGVPKSGQTGITKFQAPDMKNYGEFGRTTMSAAGPNVEANRQAVSQQQQGPYESLKSSASVTKTLGDYLTMLDRMRPEYEARGMGAMLDQARNEAYEYQRRTGTWPPHRTGKQVGGSQCGEQRLCRYDKKAVRRRPL